MNGANLFLVAHGARPGARLELYEALGHLAKSRGMPPPFDDRGPLSKNALEKIDRMPSDEEQASRLVRAFVARGRAQVVEHMHVMLDRIRTSLEGTAVGCTVDGSSAEVYVYGYGERSRGRATRDMLTSFALSEADEETYDNYVCLARFLGYPVMPRPLAEKNSEVLSSDKCDSDVINRYADKASVGDVELVLEINDDHRRGNKPEQEAPTSSFTLFSARAFEVPRDLRLVQRQARAGNEALRTTSDAKARQEKECGGGAHFRFVSRWKSK